MSEKRKSVKHDKENNIIDFQGRPTEERKAGAKKFNLKSNASLFNTEFFVYYPDETVDLSQRQDKKGRISLDGIPEENLYEFQCRYIDPGTYQSIHNRAYVIDIPNSDDLTPEQLEQAYQQKAHEQISSRETDQNFRYQVVMHCLIDPIVETVDDVKNLPVQVVNDIFRAVQNGAYGGNQIARF